MLCRDTTSKGTPFWIHFVTAIYRLLKGAYVGGGSCTMSPTGTPSTQVAPETIKKSAHLAHSVLIPGIQLSKQRSVSRRSLQIKKKMNALFSHNVRAMWPTYHQPQTRWSDFHEIRYCSYLQEPISFDVVKSVSASRTLFEGLETNFYLHFLYFSADWSKIRHGTAPGNVVQNTRPSWKSMRWKPYFSYVCMYVCMYLYIYIYVCVCVCIYIYIYYIYIQGVSGGIVNILVGRSMDYSQ